VLEHWLIGPVVRLKHRRLAVLAVVLAVTGPSCSSSDGSDGGGTTAAAATLPSEDDCRAAARDAVAPAQAFIDEHEELTVEEWNALRPPPDVAAVQRNIQERLQAAVGLGCLPALVEQEVLAVVEGLQGEGPVGSAIAAALKGEQTSQAPRELTASRTSVHPGDDVAAVLARVGAGSTVSFESGNYELTESVVIDVSLELVGKGRQQTTITSSAAGVALAFVGPGDLSVRDLALRHTGDEAASVLLAIEGGVTVRGVDISGGSGTVETGAGHGLVLAFENLPNFPERTPEQRAGSVVVDDTRVTGNEAAGILVSGDAAPRITGSTISGNARCGICFTGDAAGSVTTSTLEDNGPIGIQVVGAAHPSIEGNIVRRHGVGMLAGETSSPAITRNTLEENQVAMQAGGTVRLDAAENTIPTAERVAISLVESSTGTVRGNRIGTGAPVGIEVAGSASPAIEANTVEGAGDVGISFVETASGRASLNTVTGRDIGLQVGGSATPELLGNQVAGSQLVGMLFAGQAAGSARENAVTGSIGSAVQVTGTSHPEITANELRGGEFGITYLEASGGTAAYNQILEHRVGIQVAGTAAPQLAGNEFDGVEQAGIVYTEMSAGDAIGNRCRSTAAIGIAIAATATPAVVGNECEIVRAD
jgi:hypothetical protein